jgi:hypothetical protein
MAFIIHRVQDGRQLHQVSNASFAVLFVSQVQKEKEQFIYLRPLTINNRREHLKRWIMDSWSWPLLLSTMESWTCSKGYKYVCAITVDKPVCLSAASLASVALHSQEFLVLFFFFYIFR